MISVVHPVHSVHRFHLSFFLLVIVGLFVQTAVAQQSANDDSNPVQKYLRELNLWGGGGSGFGHSTSFQYANAGARLGIVLTGPHGPAFIRGNFEYAAEVMPLYLFFQPVTRANGVRGRAVVYGGAVSPLILKWNFTSARTVTPYFDLEGAAILTTKNVPAGDTAVVNFGSGVATGVQFFRHRHHSIALSGRILHVSNASIGDKNPSINIGAQLRLEFAWWR